jgi:hypothetical protein
MDGGENRQDSSTVQWGVLTGLRHIKALDFPKFSLAPDAQCWSRYLSSRDRYRRDTMGATMRKSNLQKEQ